MLSNPQDEQLVSGSRDFTAMKQDAAYLAHLIAIAAYATYRIFIDNSDADLCRSKEINRKKCQLLANLTTVRLGNEKAVAVLLSLENRWNSVMNPKSLEQAGESTY